MSGGHFGDCGYDYYKVAQFADEFELTLGEDLKAKFDDMLEAEKEWERIKKGPMGTVLTDEEEKCEE